MFQIYDFFPNTVEVMERKFLYRFYYFRMNLKFENTVMHMKVCRHLTSY